MMMIDRQMKIFICTPFLYILREYIKVVTFCVIKKREPRVIVTACKSIADTIYKLLSFHF